MHYIYRKSRQQDGGLKKFGLSPLYLLAKGKLVSAKDSESVEAEADDDESGVSDIVQNMESDES